MLGAQSQYYSLRINGLQNTNKQTKEQRNGCKGLAYQMRNYLAQQRGVVVVGGGGEGG